MAYGFTDYKKDPVGGYTFRTDSGKSVHLFGPDADMLASTIDRQKTLSSVGAQSQVDQLGQRLTDSRYAGALAYNGGGGAGNAPAINQRVDGGGVVQNAPAAVPPPLASGGAPSQQNPDLYGKADPRFTSIKVQPPAANAVEVNRVGNSHAAAPPTYTPPQEGVYSGLTDSQWRERGFASAHDAWLKDNTKVVPGTPGNDPAKKIATGMLVPRGEVTSTSREGGEYSAEDAIRRSDLELNYQRAKQAEYDASIAANEQYAAFSRRRAQEEANRQVEERARYEEAKAYADEAWGEVKRTQEEAKAGKIDPRRYFKEQGTFAALLSILAEGMGAYGAAMTHSPNWAHQMQQAAIDRDIEAQKAEIDQKRDEANNALALLTKRLGDRDVAEVTLRAQMNAVVDAERDAMAADLNSQNAKAAYQTWIAQRAIERDREEKAIYDQAMGKTLTQKTSAWEVPVKGTLGRRVLLSPSQQIANEAAIAKASGATGPSPEEQARLVEKSRPVHNVRLQLERVAKLAGARRNEKGEFVAEDGIPGIGRLDPGIGDDAEALDAAIVEWNIARKDALKTEPSEGQIEAFNQVTRPTTEEGFIRMLNEQDRLLRQREAYERAAVSGKAVTNVGDRSLEETQRDRDARTFKVRKSY